MGTLFVDKLDPQSGTSLEIGSSGDTMTVPSGATFNVAGTLQSGGVAVANTPAFFAFLSSSQGLSHDVHTKIQFDTERYDTASAYDNSSNYRFTCPSGQSGKYYFFAGLRYSSSTANLSLSFRVNGTNRAVASMKATSGELETLEFTTSYSLSAGDYVEVFGRHQSSGTLNVFGTSGEADSYFGGYKIIE